MPNDYPDPIRTDGSNAFAHRSMAERVPSIIDDVIARNPDYSPSIQANLQRLRDAIAGDASIQMFDAPAPDYDCWAERFSLHEGESWLDAEWLFSEFFAYRWVVEASRYWTTRRDPFQPMKKEEMESEALRTVVGEALAEKADVPETLGRRLLSCLWGNRMDLSIKGAFEQGTDAKDEHLLSNDIPAAVRDLLDAAPGHVHIIMDNAGTEEAFDFALVDALLANDIASQVTLHVKMVPVLVSDVIGDDIFQMLDALERHGGPVEALARRIRGYVQAGRLQIIPDFFWNTDGRIWELPPRLERTFRGGRLVVSKGDANYRRITNDAVWPSGAEFATAAREFPAPLIALRTIKSDTLVGVDAATMDRLDREDDGWRTRGTYGVAQYAI